MLASELARRARQAGRYDEIAIGFVRGTPSVEDAAAGLTSRFVTLYPLFMSDGYYVREALIHRLGIRDGVDRLGHRITLETPLGLNPGLPPLLLGAALEAAGAHGLEAAGTSLLLVAHGSSRTPYSRNATLAIREGIAEAGQFGRVAVGFLEEPPLFHEALASLPRPLLVLGLFAGEGMHGSDDVRDVIARYGDRDVHAVERLGGYAAIIELVMAHDLGGGEISPGRPPR